MRAIDADFVQAALTKTITEILSKSQNESTQYVAMGLASIKTIIDIAPTLDVVPVIRCRECKHKSQGISDKMRTWCSMWQCWILQGDGYCHMAAKMDAGQEDDK